ncbi:MAG: DUF4874 domain-containing protein [Rhodothermaceae bacterium]|nr:DUF4874 domain-containing protein [Rhodothermaceae bacterium]
MNRSVFQKNLLVLLFLTLAIPVLNEAGIQAQTVFTYTESDEIIANPERGLQKYSITNNTYYTATNYSSISENTISGWRTGPEKVTVIYRYFLLGNFMETEISETYLNNIQIDFDRIRNAGLKTLVRFSYTNRQSTDPQQPVKALILQHIEQLAPVLEQNKDVIVAHQAGFIGTWGEWYYTNSTEFGSHGSIFPTQWLNRKEVVDAMLAATPVEIPLQVRYPQAKITMYGSTPLTGETAYSDTPQARIGFYNDAFLNIWGDMGTYRNTGQFGNPVGTDDYEFLSNETQFLPMSGETNGLNAPRTDGDNSVMEMDLTNWSIINRDYHSSVLNGWINSGHLDVMLRFLGYRFVLSRATFEQNGADIDVTLAMENKGYARPFLSREAWLIFRNLITEEEQSFQVPGDIRTWEGEFDVVTPVDIALFDDGIYEVYLSMPDINLVDRPEYAIRLANEDVWEPETGRNLLGYIEIEDSALAVSIDEEVQLPQGALLRQNYPNPFNPGTVIAFELAEGGPVRLSVYDITGRLIKEFENGVFPAGEHRVQWEASGISSGIYLIRLDAAGITQTMRSTLLK